MAPKHISEKTAKIVWARAGGVCSYPDCFKAYERVLNSEFGEGDEWEREEWASEEDWENE